MKNVIIYANPNPKSFSASVKETIINSLKDKGQEFVVRDLYEMGYNPVLSAKDFENLHAGTLSEDILTEQEYIRNAENIFVIHPVWWTGMPAILKGYFDRTFLYGFAYSYNENGKQALLTGKKAFIFSGHGQPKSLYDQGMYTSLKQTSDEGVFGFTGIEAQHFFFPSIIQATAETKKEYLNEIETFVKSFKF